jgi:hypothetical protein
VDDEHIRKIDESVRKAELDRREEAERRAEVESLRARLEAAETELRGAVAALIKPDNAPPAPDRGADRSEPPPGYVVLRHGPDNDPAWAPMATQLLGAPTRGMAVAACWAHHDRYTAPAEARAREAADNFARVSAALTHERSQHSEAIEAARQAGREEGRREGLMEAAEYLEGQRCTYTAETLRHRASAANAPKSPPEAALKGGTPYDEHVLAAAIARAEQAEGELLRMRQAYEMGPKPASAPEPPAAPHGVEPGEPEGLDLLGPDPFETLGDLIDAGVWNESKTQRRAREALTEIAGMLDRAYEGKLFALQRLRALDTPPRPSMAVVSPEGIDTALAAEEPDCEDCHGTGYPPGDYVPGQDCETCEGGGTAEPDEEECDYCDGDGTMRALDDDGERCRVTCKVCGGSKHKPLPTPTPPGGPSGNGGAT